MKYVYPAIFTPEDGGYTAKFPDFDSCYTQGDDLADAFEMAQDVLALTLYRMEREHVPIPTPSNIKEICTADPAFASLVNSDTFAYRKQHDNRAVKKTLSIPAWLNAEAEQVGINFSAVLQNALKAQLHID